MTATPRGLRLPRRCPLVVCLATTLALASTSALASAHQRHRAAMASGHGQLAGVPPAPRPAWWKRRDADAIASRWAPAPHEIPPIPNGSIVVQNCNDSGSGSLRDALAQASDGDTIDLTQLSCSTITLTSGSLAFAQDSITLQGPGAKYLAIDGNDAYVPLMHQGAGTLYVNDLAIAHGVNDSHNNNARGGCVFSSGHVSLDSVTVAHCTASDYLNVHGVEGGAVYGELGVHLSNSSVTDGNAIAPSSYALGGGVYARGPVDVSASSISGNYTSLDGGAVYAYAGLTLDGSLVDGNQAARSIGGLDAVGNVTIGNSTISNNQAIVAVGGVLLYGYGATAPLLVVNSTISGNIAGAFGGVETWGYDARIANSTIAFNRETGGTSYAGAGGLYVHDSNVDLESTIVGDNLDATAAESDVGGAASATTSGANDLVMVATIVLPADTLATSPMLGPLAYHGGPTPTRMLMTGSPAIDAGNNVAGAAYDQRGVGFPRVIGSSADIGAYELDGADVIFAAGFDP